MIVNAWLRYTSVTDCMKDTAESIAADISHGAVELPSIPIHS